MGSGLGHPPGVTRGANAAAFAGEGDEEIVAALIAPRSRKAISEDAAFEVLPQLPLGVRRDALIFPVVATQGKKGPERVLHRAVDG